MTNPPRPGLQPVSLMKAGPTTSGSQPNALPSAAQPPFPRPSSRLRVHKTSSREDPTDYASEKATSALIRRVLCPQASSYGISTPQPPEELLPPLTSSNDVDRQLYALIAIIVKEFLISWYAKITPDQALVNEVLQVIAHCTRALEQRIRQVNVAQLVLDEIPALVEAHVTSYRLAKQQSHLSGLPTSHRALYHELNPHPGLSPVPNDDDPDTITRQDENEAVYRRLLANGMLAILLPTEDLENSSLRTLVGDIIADLILGKEVGDRICKGVFFYELIIKFTMIVRNRKDPKDSGAAEDATPNRLEKFGLLSSEEPSRAQVPTGESQFMAWIWLILHALYLFYVSLRFIVTGLSRVASNPGLGSSHGAAVPSPTATSGLPKSDPGSSENVAGRRPVLDYGAISMASTVFEIPKRMPWTSGLLALGQHLILTGPGRLGNTDGILDRFLRETIEEYVLPPTLLPNILLATRLALFPANARPAALAASPATPAFAPQPSVQLPNTDGKSLTATSPVVATSPAPAPQVEWRHVQHQRPRSARHFAGACIPSRTADPVNPSPTLPTAPATNQQAPSSTGAIAAIQRQCAASLLAVIPRSVARTLLGLPAPSSSDRTCSTGCSSSSLTNPPSPPPSRQKERSGDTLLPRSSSQQSIGMSLRESPLGDQRTDRIASPEVDPEEELLLRAIETDLLDLLADEYCNKHLVYAVLETVLMKVLPELAERSVADLMDDRGVPPVPGY
ncbi:PX-associated sorting nexin 13 [Penicillium chermesinum]|nr:PX-associated sorting nexin 13 [Penicillium chermesinum]